MERSEWQIWVEIEERAFLSEARGQKFGPFNADKEDKYQLGKNYWFEVSHPTEETGIKVSIISGKHSVVAGDDDRTAILNEYQTSAEVSVLGILMPSITAEVSIVRSDKPRLPRKRKTPSR